MKKLHHVGVTCGVLSAALVFGVRADDLTVPLGGMNITATPAAAYDKVTVKGALTVKGTGVSVTGTGAAAIGPDAGDNASVTVSGGAYLWVKGDITYGGNGGKGGKFDLSSPTALGIGWSTPACGTGGGLVTHTVSSSLVSDTGFFDLAELHTNGWLGLKQVYNANSAVKTRILFNGGATFTAGSTVTTKFKAAADAEIVLKSVNRNPILVRALYAGNTYLFEGAGRFSTEGEGDFDLYYNNTPEITKTKLSGDIHWGHSGKTIFRGNHWAIPQTNDKLPHGLTNGNLVIGPGERSGYPAVLDLNGTTQKVNNIEFGNYAYVTNTNTKRAVLEIGESMTNEAFTLSGTYGGAIDIRIKSKARIKMDSKFNPGPDVTIAVDDVTYDLHNEKFGSVAFGRPFSGTVNVSNWWVNVSPDATYVKGAAGRDLAVSVIDELNMAGGCSVDVQGGRLDIARLTGHEDATIRLHENCRLTVQSCSGKTFKFLRIVFKESYGILGFGEKKSYPHLRQIALVKEDGSFFWPGDNGYVYQTADTAFADMPAGSYKFHSDKFANGKGTELDTVNVPTSWPCSSYRSSDYNAYNNIGFFKSSGSWGGLMFTNSVPKRSDSSSWHVITVRMKDDAPKISGYQFVSNWDYIGYPVCWSVEMSDDGETWTTLDEKVDYYCRAYNNVPQSGGEGYQYWNMPGPQGEKIPFFWTTNIAPGSVSFALNGAKLRVDRGGVLDVSQTGAAAEVSRLEVDAQLGGGRISSFKPAANGVLDIVNVQESGKLTAAERKVPFAFGEIVNPENLATWTVLSGGVEVEGAYLKLTDTGVKVTGFGLLITIR